jgi:hypothetical protein
MENRRAFLKSLAAAAGAAGVTGLTASATAQPAVPASQTAGSPADDRTYWLSVMERVAAPVLQNLAQRTLRKNMPVEAPDPAERKIYTHLEAFGRLLAGIAPWLAATGLNDAEDVRRKQFVEWAQLGLDAATDPASPDFMNFTQGGQPIVDAAFLVQGILRAPGVLWEPLSAKVRQQIIAALKSSRVIGTPNDNNWVMFAAMVETGLHRMGEPTVEERLEHCLNRMLGWYKGDGAYGDGEFFHFDYYNSFVIQPMLLDVLATLRADNNGIRPAYQVVLARARRYAEIQERLIAPDGTFPSLGRSTTYRFGALQLLALIAQWRELPMRVKPAQVRSGMTAVIRRMIEAPGTFDDQGWLRIGFCGHQPSLGESYISTGSLYLCSVGLLPLGLPPTDAFWSEPAAPWTSKQLWSGEEVRADHALSDVAKVEVPRLRRG